MFDQILPTKKCRDMVYPTVVFILLSIILSGSFILIERQLVQQEREQYQYMGANQTNMIKNAFDTSLSRVYTFKTMVKDHRGDISFFDERAKEIYDDTVKQTGVHLRNIAVAPDGIVEKVYPLTGNETLLGFDLMDVSRPGNQEAVEAYKRGEPMVTDPFELVQGGTGMGARLPVFLTGNEGEVFWGFVTVTVDLDEVLKVFQLETLSRMGTSFELWYRNKDGGRVTLASSEQLPKDPVNCPFTIQNLTWYLDVAPRQGWNDYLELTVGIAGILAISMLIAVLLYDKVRIRRTNEQLEYVAHRDGLTGCYSRQYVNTMLVNRENGRWKEPEGKYSVIILDIDHFKQVNDTYGHDTGDKAIRAISRVLQNQTREEKGDCVIRQGGDEFILLYQDISREQFVYKLKQVLEEVRQIHFPEFPELRLTLSAGGVHFLEGENMQYYEMIHLADKKLYKAKENGRNQFVA